MIVTELNATVLRICFLYLETSVCLLNNRPHNKKSLRKVYTECSSDTVNVMAMALVRLENGELRWLRNYVYEV